MRTVTSLEAMTANPAEREWLAVDLHTPSCPSAAILDQQLDQQRPDLMPPLDQNKENPRHSAGSSEWSWTGSNRRSAACKARQEQGDLPANPLLLALADVHHRSGGIHPRTSNMDQITSFPDQEPGSRSAYHRPLVVGSGVSSKAVLSVAHFTRPACVPTLQV